MLSSRGPTLTIVTDHLPRGVVDQPYSVTLTASGGTPPYSWSLASQHPSSWLTLGSATGVLSGTPRATGIEGVRIEVKDALGQRVRVAKNFTIPLLPAVGFDYYVSPSGDDTLGAGSLQRPWSLLAINTKVRPGSRVGLLPGTYQYGTNNGVRTSLCSMTQSPGGLMQPPKGTATRPTFIGSCDTSGKYSPRTAIIDLSEPGTACEFNGSISGSALKVDSVRSGEIAPGLQYLQIPGGEPAWIGAQLSGTPGLVGTYRLFPYHYSYSGQMTTVAISGISAQVFAIRGSGNPGTATPTEGYLTVAGIVFRHFTYSAVWAYQCIGVTTYDCEFGPARFPRSNTNPGAVHFNYCDGCETCNNKFHNLVTGTPCTFELTTPASGMWTGGTLSKPWPFESSIRQDPYMPFAIGGQVVPSLGNRPGLICTHGSKAVTYQNPVTLAAVPANDRTGTYAGGSFTSPFPFASASNYPLVLSTGQVVTISCTHNSAAFNCNPPVALTPGSAPSVAASINGLQITGAPSTTLTLALCVFAPWGSWSYIQIPGGYFIPNKVHHNTIYHSGMCGQKDFMENCIDFYNNYVEYAEFGVEIRDSATVNGITANAASGTWIQGTGPKQTSNVHHNIFGGFGYFARNMMGGIGNQGVVNITNNTLVNGNATHTADYPPSKPSKPGVFNFHNNIQYWSPVSAMGPGGQLSIDYGSAPNYNAPSSSVDGNCYQDQMRFGFAMYPNAPQPRGVTLQLLSGWQRANAPNTPPGFPGYDKNSHYLTQSPFATKPVPVRTPADIQSYALDTSWTANAALDGGVDGATCGALDGSGSVGCDF